MPVYYTPGIYFEKMDPGRDKISGIRTDIAGFVGITEKGPLNKPVRIESWKQFQSVFGSFIPQGYCAYAVQGFFENGGDVCYVTRIADLEKAEAARIILFDKTEEITHLGESAQACATELELTSIGSLVEDDYIRVNDDEDYYQITASPVGLKIFISPPLKYGYKKNTEVKKVIPTIKISAANEGQWGKKIKVSLKEVGMEFTLSFSLGDRIKEIFENLSLNPKHSRYLKKIINGQSNLVTVEDMNSSSAIPNNLPDPQKLVKGFLYLKDGMDGISSIEIGDFIGDPSLEKRKGLRCYEEVDEVNMICIPDIMAQPIDIELPPPKKKLDPCAPPKEKIEAYTPEKPKPSPVFSGDYIERAQKAMIEHCELLKDRVAILDPPFNLDISQIYEWRQKFSSKYAALYYPWIRVNDPLRLKGNITRLIPGSGHIGGVYARTDLTKGVHKAPANEEILGAKDISWRVNDSEQDILNPVGVNCLRTFPGRGVLIWGTRTISSDPIWKYINIRRLLLMIEESVEEAIQWAVFEPNDVHLRNGIKVAVSSFLEEIWRNGALAGKTASEAFFVKCDEENNPQYVIDAGKIITDIGVAPSIPGEFIVFRIGKVKDSIGIVKEGE